MSHKNKKALSRSIYNNMFKYGSYVYITSRHKKRRKKFKYLKYFIVDKMKGGVDG